MKVSRSSRKEFYNTIRRSRPIDWKKNEYNYGTSYELKYNSGRLVIEKHRDNSELTVEFIRNSKVHLITSRSNSSLILSGGFLFILIICILANTHVIAVASLLSITVGTFLYWFIPMKKYYWFARDYYNITQMRKSKPKKKPEPNLVNLPTKKKKNGLVFVNNH